MCQVKGKGDRCASHAKIEMRKTKEAYDANPTPENKKSLHDASVAYYATQSGSKVIKELVTNMSPSDPQYQEILHLSVEAEKERVYRKEKRQAVREEGREAITKMYSQATRHVWQKYEEKINNPEGTYGGKTAEEWETARQDATRREAESFERSDTDGFVSQWAANAIARENSVKAKVARQGGMYLFETLVDKKTGEVLPTKMVDGQYGASWALLDEDGRVKGFVGISHAKTPEARANYYAKKGYALGVVGAPAGVGMGGNGISVSPYVYRKKSSYNGDGTILITKDWYQDVIDLVEQDKQE